MISTKVIYVTNVPKTSASGKGSTATGVPIQHLFCKSKLSHSKNFILKKSEADQTCPTLGLWTGHTQDDFSVT